MKRLLAITAIAAATLITTSASAGPTGGRADYRSSYRQQRAEQVDRAYALTGRTDNRMGRDARWIGPRHGHRYVVHRDTTVR